jgi:dolichol-phosphate mannosyltransferase
MSRIFAMLPTYNESENIGPLLDAILALSPEMEALVVDDNSPDGTWKIVGERAKADPRVHLLHRMRDKGRGLAGIAGFQEALRLGADAVVEMDADWSHDPKWIPSMIEAWRKGGDVVVASRLVPGGGESGRPASRGVITACANFYIRTMLGMPHHDQTGGFRLFSRQCLAALPWAAMHASGPEVVQETALAAHARGFKIVEVPFIFTERRFGQSTFNRRIMIHSLMAMARLRWRPGRLAPGETRGGAYGLPLALTWPLSVLYGAGRWLDRQAHAWGIAPRRRLPAPVVCVGNLTVGGTGKTPMVAVLARQLQAMGRRVAVLSRGYRAEDPPEKPLIVSDGESVLARAEQSGDESRALAEQRQGFAVVVHPNRYRGGMTAIRQLDCDLLVLDDGFQHDALERDLDIVLWDLRDDPRRQRLLPAGRLREGLSALRRAGAIVLTHAEYLLPGERARRADRIMAELKRHAPSIEVFQARLGVTGWRQIGGRPGAALSTEPESSVLQPADARQFPWSGRKAIAISGLARPAGFEATVAQSGGILMHHFDYPDHYVYDRKEVETWRSWLERLGAEMALTTAKDAVKLELLPLAGLPLYSVEIGMEITEPERWEMFLRDRLKLAPPAPAPASDSLVHLKMN